MKSLKMNRPLLKSIINRSNMALQVGFDREVEPEENLSCQLVPRGPMWGV